MKNIRDLYFSQLPAILEKNGFKRFRHKQLYEWIELKGVRHFQKIPNIAQKLKDWLGVHFVCAGLESLETQASIDGSVKYALRLPDKLLVECVFLPHLDRSTLCLSTQVGCPLACDFCASGKLAFKRNLRWWEITDQYNVVRQNAAVSNLVFMGMGEPLLNLEQVLLACEYFTHTKGPNLSQKQITISTSGVVTGIEKLAKLKKYNLAVSLHSPFQGQREKLMPVAKKYPLSVLFSALRDYTRLTGKKVTFEYVLLGGMNTSKEAARALRRLLSPLPCKVNLIYYNGPTEGKYKTPARWEAERFRDELSKMEQNVMVRRSMGRDVEGACGQLALRLSPKTESR